MSFYEVIGDITADTGIRVKGKTLEEVFCKSILATFNEITDITQIDIEMEYEITVSGEMPYLLADAINRALLLFETKGFVAKECELLEISDEHVKIVLAGSSFKPEEHESGLVIKAATYHRLKLEKLEDEYVGEVIFDI